jgi:flagella basal body P-ring formation protein FlgA
LINQNYLSQSKLKPELSVKILSPEHLLDKVCDNPEISLIGTMTRPLGNRTILAKCGAKRNYIRINIHAIGSYWIAKETVQPGDTISNSGIMLKKGDLNGMPADLIFNPEQINDNVATRLIKAGQPIAANQLRKRWIVISGEEISISAQGNGFHILTSGKAMDNAGMYDQLRIRTRSGQILTGTATGRAVATIKVDY